jgi:hypothetical protein
MQLVKAFRSLKKYGLCCRKNSLSKVAIQEYTGVALVKHLGGFHEKKSQAVRKERILQQTS